MFTNTSAWTECETRSIFKRSLIGLNTEFLLDWLSYQGKRASMPYYLPISGGWILGCIPFPRVLALYEMQTTTLRTWTLVTVSISYTNNHYTTSAYVCLSFTPLAILCHSKANLLSIINCDVWGLK